MLTAVVLFCALTGTGDLTSCTRGTATDVLLVPESFSNPMLCLLHGQAYAAVLVRDRPLRSGLSIKVVCERNGLAREAPNKPQDFRAAAQAPM
jgi:hypothetical protein